jgi:hypothetical protein
MHCSRQQRSKPKPLQQMMPQSSKPQQMLARRSAKKPCRILQHTTMQRLPKHGRLPLQQRQHRKQPWMQYLLQGMMLHV